MDLRYVEIPKIEDDAVLEELIRDIYACNSNFANVNLHGRPGQKQDGVDVYARHIENLTWAGMQCKVRSTNKSFSKTELKKEVDDALNFNPTLSEYSLYTTLNRDVHTQSFVREIADELSRNDDFKFDVFFWEDIADLLRDENNRSVYLKYYSKFFADSLATGHAIGKLVNLELQFDNIPDSHYELIIGKIPNYKEDKGQNVDYYRGTYFIVNLHELRIEFFTKSQTDSTAVVFPSDIVEAISNKIDCYRIAKFLQGIDDIDKFIYEDVHTYHFSITSKERQEYQSED